VDCTFVEQGSAPENVGVKRELNVTMGTTISKSSTSFCVAKDWGLTESEKLHAESLRHSTSTTRDKPQQIAGAWAFRWATCVDSLRRAWVDDCNWKTSEIGGVKRQQPGNSVALHRRDKPHIMCAKPRDGMSFNKILPKTAQLFPVRK